MNLPKLNLHRIGYLAAGASAAVLTVAAEALACGALNAAIRTGVETLGPKITGTAVSVATVVSAAAARARDCFFMAAAFR
jgi:hypothetical protein